MPANLPQQAILLSVDLLQQSLQVVAALHLYFFVEQSKTHQSRTCIQCITHRQSAMAQCVCVKLLTRKVTPSQWSIVAYLHTKTTKGHFGEGCC